MGPILLFFFKNNDLILIQVHQKMNTKDILVSQLERNVFSLHFYEMRMNIQILQIKAKKKALN